MISFELNGSEISVNASDDTPLLQVLRDHLNMADIKDNSAMASSDAWAVLCDGEPCSSQMPVSAVAGRSVTTIDESIEDTSTVANPNRRSFFKTGTGLALGVGLTQPLTAAAAKVGNAALVQAKSTTPPSKNWISNYDVIVVGAGYGGLITGAILARNGLKTVVVEKTDVVGGHLGAMNWHGYWLDYGHRDAADVMDNFFIYNRKGQFYKKAADAAGVHIPLALVDRPAAMIHVRTPDNKVGKVVPWSPEQDGGMQLGIETYQLSPEQVSRLQATLTSLLAEDPEKWLPVTFKEWLPKAFPLPGDERIHKLLLHTADIFFVFPTEMTSVGRFIKAMKDPAVTARGNDPKIGSLQGCMEPFAKAIRRHGGEIKLDLHTEEILMEGNKVCGVVVRDKTSSVQVLRAPVVVFAQPSWLVFKLLDETHFPQEFVSNAMEVEKAFRGDNIILYLGLSRVPTIRSSGKPETFAGWQGYEGTNGFMVATLASPSIAPPGKHMLWAQRCTGGPGLSSQPPFKNFAEAKFYVDQVHDYLRDYYSNLDEITEWENYQWTKCIASAAFYWPFRKSPIRVNDLDGLYFVGSTTETEGIYGDVDADSALQATQLILQRHGK